ncbi:M20 family metallopeptidase [Wenzhouxiangella marina]|uniref:Peptidase M20 n=1 Tax=Wenzhouxiangella marina TaxID=1579979 RepID=A0A0K0XY16_9GAMM|nr:M20 family metallopeptidase [Wenzhouxiangella marina]AKS42527.1 Peptidase M20 [Wenzhouxiangella marina]MBB6085696.1 acetylornithine deacetylase/succinyl-diaminopimelate desuccinylase-like protein [Wenzhouxiangella marina]
MDKAERLIREQWAQSITPELVDYIRIPAKSPHFDPDWARHGYIDEAVEHIARWCREQPIEGLSVEVLRLGERTPVIFMEVPGTVEDTVLLYGHLDKQPEMTGWAEGLGPWEPVIRDGRLYGRGGADDGYAAYASLAAIRALQAEGRPHARFVILIEACEESGSYDLPAYIEHLDERIGTPSLVVCLDSGAGNYEQLWITTSLRGMAAGSLEVDILEEGVHSGYASGIVPSSFRIARQLLSRLEDESTGAILPEGFSVEIPEQRRAQLAAVADALGEGIHQAYPWVEGAGPVGQDSLERLLNRNWRAALAVTGAAGLPDIGSAGNVLRPGTALKLSLRLPPTLDGDRATELMKQVLESDPPYGARVRFVADQSATGWNAPPVADWLDQACQAASRAVFGKAAMYMGEGGTIPFMAMLGESFPESQFLITGVLGPKSNAHGPNEFLHLDYARRLTEVVARVLGAHAGREFDRAA